MNVAAAAKTPAEQPLDAESVRRDFPILARSINGKPLVYLDSAASAQQPLPVMRAVGALRDAFACQRAPRRAHLEPGSDRRFEGARDRLRRFVNASSVREIVFVRGTTEAINLVAQSYVRPRFVRETRSSSPLWSITPISCPGRSCASRPVARSRWPPSIRKGELLFDAFVALLSRRTRLVAIAHVSNALGDCATRQAMIAAAHEHGARVLIDGRRRCRTRGVDVRALDVDFYAFSSHKLYGPTRHRWSSTARGTPASHAPVAGRPAT